jgi:hypothetical protein
VDLVEADLQVIRILVAVLEAVSIQETIVTEAVEALEVAEVAAELAVPVRIEKVAAEVATSKI